LLPLPCSNLGYKPRNLEQRSFDEPMEELTGDSQRHLVSILHWIHLDQFDESERLKLVSVLHDQRSLSGRQAT